jgi:Glycosyl transferases group 1
MRIASYFENRLGRNDGNPLYALACLKRMQYYGEVISGKQPNQDLLGWFSADTTTGQKKQDIYAEQAARELFEKEKEVIEVDHLFPTGEINAFGTYDLNLHVDWGEDALRGVLPYEPKEVAHPIAYWASDTHINNGMDGDSYPYRMRMAKKADFAFVAQKRGLEMMQKDGMNGIWLPHAFEPQAYYPIPIATKKYDICFVGNVNSQNREDALDKLFAAFPNFYYGQALFDEAARKFCESKIVFNIAMTDDLNMRVFETLGTGSFLLTNWIPTIEEFFEDGKHLVLYRNEEEMIEKAKYYLEHDDEREKIAQAGYEEVISKHKIQDRVNVILKTFIDSKKLTAV